MKTLFNKLPKSILSSNSSFMKKPILHSVGNFNFGSTNSYKVLDEFKFRHSSIYKEEREKAAKFTRVGKMFKFFYDKSQDDKSHDFLAYSLQEKIAFKKAVSVFHKRDYINEKKRKLIQRVTGAKDENLNFSSFCTIEKFEQCKDAIYKKYPKLVEKDLERNLKKLDDVNDRIDYIMDHYFTNYEEEFAHFYEHPMEYIDGTEYVLLRRPAEMIKRLHSFIDDYIVPKFIPKGFDLEPSLKNVFVPGLDEEMFQSEGMVEEYSEREVLGSTEGEGSNVLILSELLARINPEKFCNVFDEVFCQNFVTFAYKDLCPLECFEKDLVRTEEYAIASMRLDAMEVLRKRFLYDSLKDQPMTYEFNLAREHLNKQRNDYHATFLNHYREMISGRAKTADNHRIDVGMIITRPAIFLTMDKKNIEYNNYKKEFYKKYEIDLEGYVKDLDVFNSAESIVFKEQESIIRENFDNEPNTRIHKSKKRKTIDAPEFEHNNLYKNNETAYANSYLLKDNIPEDEYNFYCSNSKHYLRVDPRVKNTKSIQTHPCFDVYLIMKNKFTGEWEFPTMPLENGCNFRDGLELFKTNLTRERFNIHLPGIKPVIQISREFYTHERNNPINEGLVGVRTYYFPVYHESGEIKIFTSERHNFGTDWLLIRKNELNKYFTREYYSMVVPFLKN